MKKSLKITLIVAAVIALLVVVAALLVSPLAKRYVEKHDRELLGRSIRMEQLRINIFTGRMRITDLRIGDANDSTTFFRLDSFDMRMRLRSLLAHRVEVRRISFTGPDLKVYQRGAEFSFDDIVEHFRGDTTQAEVPAAKSSRPWEVGIYDISIRNGHIYYKDLLLDATWGLNDVNLSIPGIYFSGAKTDVGAVLNFAEGGSLETQVAYDIETSEFDIGLHLRSLTLDNTLPYFRQSLDVTDIDGRLWADINLRGDAEHLLSLRADGEASLSGFALRDAQQRPVIGIDTLAMKLAEGDLGQMRFRFDRLYVGGFSALFELTPRGNNFAALLKPSAPKAATTAPDPAEQTSAPTPTLQIADFEIARSSIALHDKTLHKPFEYHMTDIRMHSRDFDPATRNNLVVEARMQKTGAAKLRWEGSLDDLNNHNITLALSNVALRDFTPYCEHYTAYPLTNGNLTFRSQNVIRNRNLDGTNHLDLFEPKAGKKRKDLKPEMKIPLKLGLYVLKDKKGHVKMDLPIKGSLDSPEFSYRKIVLKAIGNVLLKVVTAPFSFLSGNKDNLEYIAIDPQQYAFTSEQYASLDKIAQMLQDKPDLHIALTQRIDLRRALPRQAADALRMAYAAHLNGGDTSRTIAAGTTTLPADTIRNAIEHPVMPADTVSAAVASGAEPTEPTAQAPAALSPEAAPPAVASAEPAAITPAITPAAAIPAAPRQPRLSLLEYEKILQLDIRTPEIAAFADSLLTARSISPQSLSAEEKAVTLFSEQAAQQLRRMMELRDRAAADYISSTYRLSAPAFSLQPLDSTALDAYTGRDRYTISLEVEGERVEVGEAEGSKQAGETQSGAAEQAEGLANPTAGTEAVQ